MNHKLKASDQTMHSKLCKTHWATNVFSTQLLDYLDQNLLLIPGLDSRDLENVHAVFHPDDEEEDKEEVRLSRV